MVLAAQQANARCILMQIGYQLFDLSELSQLLAALRQDDLFGNKMMWCPSSSWREMVLTRELRHLMHPNQNHHTADKRLILQ